MNARVSDEPAQKNAMHRILWVVLVVLVPLLVGTAMVGGALQFLGVPVVQNVMKVIHPSAGTSVQNQISQKTEELKLKAQISTLQSQNQTASAQLKTEEQQVAQLQQTNNQLKKELGIKVNERTKAEQEAEILKGMDPSAAAGVLAKLDPSAAADVIAVMAPADSGPILEAMDPTEAGKLMTLASQVNLPSDTSNNTVENSSQGNSSNTAG